MAQRIVNIKAGQKFIVVQDTTNGFPEGCIVEALSDIKDCGRVVRGLRWVGGYEPKPIYKQADLTHLTVDLKRYKGKIK